MTINDTEGRKPLRLQMRGLVGSGQLDGGWWPQTRDLRVELRDLVDNFPEDGPRIVRAVYSAPDWDEDARRVAVAGGSIGVGCSSGADTHVVLLSTDAHTLVRLLLVPSELSADEGSNALTAAADSGNDGSAELMLRSAVPGHARRP